jgi:hypothetical protein
MRKILFVILLFSFTNNVKAQFFQYGMQAGFFGKQTVNFKNSVVLDSTMFYRDSLYKLEKNIVKKKGSHPVSFEAYLNYRFTARKYVGLNFRYIKQAGYKSGNDASYNPEISVIAPSIGISAGYIRKIGIFDIFAEGGLSATQLKFKYVYNEPYFRNTYSRYLNQKNSFLMGFGKVGFVLYVFSFSTRMDFQIADIRNKSGIKNITYTPTFNVGFDLRSGLIGKKRIHVKTSKNQLDEDAYFKETFDLGKVEMEYGVGATLTRFQLKNNDAFSYTYLASPIQVQLKNKWSQTTVGLFINMKYAPFKKKHFILSLLVNNGAKSGKVKIGTATLNTNNATNNSIDTKTTDLTFESSGLQLGLGAGYQFKVSNLSFMDVSPIINFTAMGNEVTSKEIKGYFNWSNSMQTNYGLNVSYKTRHYGLSFKMSKGLSPFENNNRFKYGQNYSLSIFLYNAFKY